MALIFSCQRPDVTPVGVVLSADEQPISVEEAQHWFEQHGAALKPGEGARLAGGRAPKFTKKPLWKQAKTIRRGKTDAVSVRFERDVDAVVPRIQGQEKGDQVDHRAEPIGYDEFSTLVLYKKGKEVKAEILTTIPDKRFYDDLRQKKPIRPFTGQLLITDLDENFLRGYSYVDGKAIGSLQAGSGTNPGARSSGFCVSITYYSRVSYMGWDGNVSITYVGPALPIYSQTFCYMAFTGGQGGGEVEADHAIALKEAWDYANSGGGTVEPDLNDAFSYPGFNDTPIVSITDQVDCFTNTDWRQNKYEISFYVDQPGNGGSGSSNIKTDAGHVFVTFRQISRTDGSVIERTFGFYPLETNKATLGSPGRIHNNATSPYDISITHLVDAERMADAAAAAKEYATKEYVLSDFNCTDYAKRIAEAANVWLPVQSEAITLFNSSLWISSPGKLGQALREAAPSNSDINTKPGEGPVSRGSCR